MPLDHLLNTNYCEFRGHHHLKIIVLLAFSNRRTQIAVTRAYNSNILVVRNRLRTRAIL